MLDTAEETESYLQALDNEARASTHGTPLAWLELEGHAVNALPPADLQRLIQAAGGADASVGMEVNLRYLVSGALAGYRAIGIDRMTFRVDDASLNFEEPVRRARAMGAFATVEIVCGRQLNGAKLLTTLQTAVAATPAQICLRPSAGGSLDSALLERAASLLGGAGFTRDSLWMFSQTSQHFDTFSRRMTGTYLGFGPCAVTCSDGIFRNPPLEHWLQTRQSGGMEVTQLHGRLLNFLSLAGGIYAMRVHRDTLNRAMLGTASRLERLGVIDSTGMPRSGWPMEFCHRVARAAWQVFSVPEEEQ
jgi:hypothetical protein